MSSATIDAGAPSTFGYGAKNQPGQPGEGQVVPAELVTTLVGLGVTFGPSIVEGILDLFQKQQGQPGQQARPQSVRPMSTGPQSQGQGQMIPADLVGSLIDLGVTYGPGLVEDFLDLFQKQQGQPGQQARPQSVRPMSTGPQSQGQGQMIPADLVGSLIDVGIKYPEFSNCFGQDFLDLFQKQQGQPGQQTRPQSVRPMSTGPQSQGQGQGQMIPADLFSSLVDVGIKHGPDIVEGILGLFQKQQGQPVGGRY